MTADPLSLDGGWTLYVGDTPDGTPAGLSELPDQPIDVPGLWEAQGLIHFDGVAWYQRDFLLDDADGRWRLHFGAVMDSADVWVNGVHVGGQELLPFTPFELDVTGVVRSGTNTVSVRVHDPAADDPAVLRSAHGKQGWANDVFPSPPSLYATYGGIWQSVTLLRHGTVTVADVFVQPDPDHLTVTVELGGAAVPPEAEPLAGLVEVRAAGLEARQRVVVGGEGRTVVRFDLGRTDAPRWTPEDPVLHSAEVTFRGDDGESAGWSGRFGLRTVGTNGGRLLLNGEPFRMRSALVQGFWPGSLYAAPDREAIREEVEAARAAGFNTLRLHVKAFEPDYLDVCDELGMVLHCDIPVAEPIAHDDMGRGTDLDRRCVEAVRAQVRRDRNHPSIILWSAMNEIGLHRPEIRNTDGYERFARMLVGAVRAEDPTRPVVENDWIEPDPDRVFEGDVLTAHWYGRLQRGYLAELEAKTAAETGHDRPLLVSEFGDWGLPDLDDDEQPEFWHQSAVLAKEIAASAWSGTPAAFIAATQRYQGLSDRLQGEVFRRHDEVAGYCLTELTDVPHELNGVLDFTRRAKEPAAAEIRLLNQAVHPMARLVSYTVRAGGRLGVRLSVANDGPPLTDVVVAAQVGDGPVTRTEVDLAGHRATDLGAVELQVPATAGDLELRLTLEAQGAVLARNSYPLWAVGPHPVAGSVRLVGSGASAAALGRLGIGVDGPGPLVVAEGALDEQAGARVRAALAQGDTVVVLRQGPDSSRNWPLPVQLVSHRPEWGPTVFQFTTAGLPWRSLPAGRLLTTEHFSVEGSTTLTDLGALPDQVEVLIGAYKPPPESMVGTVVCSVRAGAGRLVACQLELAEATARGDVAASAILADLLDWAGCTRP